ncbi:MAG: response regulator [Proteobacteria bacterium]|nr:response regulator [Pseudomonadota bacterium]
MKQLRLQTKLSIAFATITILSCAILTLALFLVIRLQIRTQIRERLHDAVALAALQIDSRLHSTLTDPSHEGNETYLRLRRQLQVMRDAATDIFYTYTMRLDDGGKIVFVVDAEDTSEEIAHVGDVYLDASPKLVSIFPTLDHPVVEESFYTDKWGTWLTGYAPFYLPDGQREGILGMDIKASKVIERERQFLFVALCVFICTIPLSLGFGWLLGRKMAAPITALTECAERVSTGDLSCDAPVKTGDEIGTLALAFNHMMHQLSQSMKSLKHQITERKLAEQENAELERRLHTAQKMEAIGTLAGGIAHDFNNLLMGIQGNLSLMLHHMGPNHPQSELMKNMEDYVQGATRVTRQLLDFARGGKYELTPTNIKKLIEKTAAMFGRTHKEIRINTDNLNDAGAVEVDPTQMEQVLLNIFVNASQAMPDGGWLYLSADRMDIEHRDTGTMLEPGSYVKIVIKDTGIGMEPSVLDKIFDPFFTTKEKERGTGLGLASAYGIVRNHGGVIYAKSEEGVGSQFYILLPASGREVISETSENRGILSDEGQVLIVDDELVATKTGKAMLEALGFQVLCASGGLEALEIYGTNQNSIVLIILDMVMPGMNGDRVFRELRKINPQARILISSGYNTSNQINELLRTGLSAFISKPFDLESLSAKIREVFEK